MSSPTHWLHPYSSRVAAQWLCRVSETFSCLLRFTCKTWYLESGRCWVRTSDLCRVKALKPVPARPVASGNYAILQVFYENSHSGLSIPYASVPARLQYGCSNFTALKSVTGHRIPTWFLPVLGHHCRFRYSRAAARKCLPSLIVCSASSSLTVSGVAE